MSDTSYAVTSALPRFEIFARENGWRCVNPLRPAYVSPAGYEFVVVTRAEMLLGLPMGTSIYLGPDWHKMQDVERLFSHLCGRLVVVDQAGQKSQVIPNRY